MSHRIQLRTVPYDHPDAVKLNDQVQLEYQERYDGEGDVTFLDPAMFAAPHGLYLLAYDATDTPVASGGWRSQDENDEGYSDGDAELKRMYVVPDARGLGLARRILAVLEEDARAAGRLRMVLETGDQQPEAIALYLSSGYTPSPKFGHYRFHASSRCMAKPLKSSPAGV
ncbi:MULTISPECIES: GNAT family N-acetyltransferase [unclassified Streptomyces]|uniref:GNAT family N-acetyltransferase n=1 Tax=unclassified Streptomyces TaxID=2593676 RepID=UPI002DDB273A|nr:GNAT family N-acetyltransferase [Streptomyces sp. NBC_01294]WRZ58879.1 GNAT family N-acetyltransferase [Streptomyces sp. NBC_01294]